MPGRDEPVELIVVGVDGSRPSLAALAWAVAEARLRGAAVEAVHAWHVPAAAAEAAVPVDGLEAAAAAVLDQSIREVAGVYPGVEVRRRAVCGAAAQVLIEAARDADLLVVEIGRAHV